MSLNWTEAERRSAPRHALPARLCSGGRWGCRWGQPSLHGELGRRRRGRTLLVAEREWRVTRRFS